MVADRQADALVAELATRARGGDQQALRALVVAEATRWLDDADRQPLSLWWLTAAGALRQAELADALGLSPAHAAQRIQRMEARLEAARVVVRALRADPRCPALEQMATDWPGTPDSWWRERFARHTRECRRCGRYWSELVPARRLLAGLAVRVPAAMRRTGTAEPDELFRTRRRGLGVLTAQPLAVLAASAVAIIAGAGIAYAAYPRTTAPVPYATVALSSSPAASPVPSATRPAPSARSQPSSAARPAAPRYGSVVDAADAAPPPNRAPGALPRRPESGVHGSPGHPYLLFRRGDSTLTGTGYFEVHWDVWHAGRGGQIAMPTWTGLSGKLFHVASGGGQRLATPVPPGAQQVWRNEFYYLDGSVTLHLNTDGGAGYGLGVIPQTWAAVTADITAAPDPARGILRYGLVRDTGTDAAPVPQYLTRTDPADPASVPQHSAVR